MSEPLSQLRTQVLKRWREFPSEHMEALDHLLNEAIVKAEASEPEQITVMNPVSRPVRLRLAVIVGGGDLDTMYHNEWAELAVSEAGRCYLVYRRRDGGDYAVEWTAATSVPTSIMRQMPEVLAKAMLEGDGDPDQ